MSGDQFRAIRQRAGLTQAEFADALGYHLTSMTRFENGSYRIPGKLKKLVLALFGPRRNVSSKKPSTSRVGRSKR